ncbi:hypothetical protein niasHT_015094 [Heterodera trifolii]|uniref:Uncharacterized protein n=1 Tax=Heterodera trifolii TaxID=157864 RepID=A0ABD2LA02_9BILA
MYHVTWELQANCKIPCAFPNRCWEPLHFDNPNICLGASVDPNNFTNYFSLPAFQFVLILLAQLFFGLLLGFFLAFFLCFLCSGRLSRRSSKNRAFGDHSLPNKNILRHSLRSRARKNASSLAIVSTHIGEI